MHRLSKAGAFLLVVTLPWLAGTGLRAQDSDESGTSVAQRSESKFEGEASDLLNSIREDRAELARLQEARDQAEGEDRALLEQRVMTQAIEMLVAVDALVAKVIEQEEQGEDAAEFRQAAEDLVGILAPMARLRVESIESRISDLKAQRETAAPDELMDLETELTASNDRISFILDAAVQNTSNMDALGLPAAEEKERLGKFLSDRAANAAARIQLALDQIGTMQSLLAETPDDADLKTELSGARVKKKRGTDNLSTTIAMLDRLGIDTSEHQKLLFEATGEITTDILDTQVAIGLFQEWMDRARTSLTDAGPQILFKVLVFVLILLAFNLLSRIIRRLVRRAVSTSRLNFSQLLQNMFVSASGNTVMLIGILVALSQMGLALGPVLAGLGIAGFIVGFALQEVLGNFASGMMILIYRPFDVGDLIEAAGVFGKVDSMNMVSTSILTIDNQTLVVPNSKIWGDVITNLTAQRIRRIDMVFGISYGADIPHAEKVLEEILRENPMVLDDPAPVVRVHNLGDSSVDLVVRPWVATDDYWEGHWAITRAVKMRFDQEGIGIPFPQRDVHLHGTDRAPAQADADADAP